MNINILVDDIGSLIQQHSGQSPEFDHFIDNVRPLALIFDRLIVIVQVPNLSILNLTLFISHRDKSLNVSHVVRA